MKISVRAFPALLAAALLLGFTSLSARADTEGSFDRTLNVTGPVDLDVQTGSGHIELHAGGSSAVVVHAKIRVREGFFGSASGADRVHAIETHPPIQQNGNVIRLGRIDDPELR